MDLAESLRGLVASQHLQSEAVALHAARCAAHPVRLLIIDDFLLPDVADCLTDFVENEAVYEPRQGTFQAGAPEGFHYEDGHLGTGALSRSAATFVSLFAAFADGRMIRLFERLVGSRLGAAESFSARRLAPGGFIQPHTDRKGSRQLAWNLHLTRAWRAGGGGNFSVVDRTGHVSNVPPLYNALVLFDVQADREHFVEPITGHMVRLTLGGWVHASTAPDQSDCSPEVE